ncbi:MAG: hypothetical protein QOJ35_1058 [Solirubrobacteraceae bacterium]|nr:hypothetical protein [Solirubrobacteraceae bacterium]
MKRVLISLVAVAAVGWSVAPSQAQQGPGNACPPGQTGNNPYCQVPPPRGCDKFTAKLSLARATFNSADRTLSILAPITRLASGRAPILLQGAHTTTTFTAPVDGQRRRIRITHQIKAAQARLGTGILTIRYRGDANTRPQTVRLRAANNPSRLTSSRPVITETGFLKAGGTTTKRARGVVRVQLEYVNRNDGETVTLERSALIQNGRWSVNSELTPSIRTQIAQRCGTVHSYVLFTGYRPRLIRGEMHSFEVLPSL